MRYQALPLQHKIATDKIAAVGLCIFQGVLLYRNHKERGGKCVCDTKQDQLFLCWDKRLRITDSGLRTGPRHWHRIATTNTYLTKSPFGCELPWHQGSGCRPSYKCNTSTSLLWKKASSALDCGCWCVSGKLHSSPISLSLHAPLPGLPLRSNTSILYPLLGRCSLSLHAP